MAKENSSKIQDKDLSFEGFKTEVLNDYRIVCESRQASLLGRREVLTGKAKFGIFGDGKEVAQIAMAKAFRKGDFRAGYYRDQTFMFAIGESDIEKFFAQLYANPDVEAEPCSAGRSMNGHFGTRSLNPDGTWKNLTEQYNSSADISPTAGQMPRLLGLAWASKLYRNNPALGENFPMFSHSGNEVAFGTIGDASTSEGVFFETINAAGVLQVPMAISVWDDGYGISVPAKYQTTKQNISEILKGFAKTEDQDGYYIFRGKGWDYPGLIEMYQNGIKLCRDEHVPVLFHVREVTQPQGHSTSGSHERYKSQERLKWEEEFDCIVKMKDWMIDTAIATSEELDAIDEKAKKTVRDAKKRAWDAFSQPIKAEKQEALVMLDALIAESSNAGFLNKEKEELNATVDTVRKDIMHALRSALRITRNENSNTRQTIQNWISAQDALNYDRYNSYLHSQSSESINNIKAIEITYADEEVLVDGREVLQANFDVQFGKNPLLVAFGEDLGKIGDVNQGFAGLQEKYGEVRISDTGIREATIAGQGIGLAMRGLRPIAEIQYLDYLLYAIQILSDDLATLQYRTKGGQKAPVIIRTRGHRLEGIWHSGSPMAMILGTVRGIHVLVPRDMTRAAAYYNAMLQTDEPAIIIEPLNGYRSKERLPANLGEFAMKPGYCEVLNEGTDLTLVTYGSCVRIAQDAILALRESGISVELIDVQSLLPFDLDHRISASLKKTNRLMILDEDVPGGAAAYILQEVLEKQKGYQHLDSAPVTLSAKEHRPAYGTDGDYFSKPSSDDVFETAYAIMTEVDPVAYPPLFR